MKISKPDTLTDENTLEGAFMTGHIELNNILNSIDNHQTCSLQAMSYRDIDPKVKDKVYELFKNKFTPSLALAKLHDDLIITRSESEYEIKKADRSVIPLRDDMLYLYKLFNLRPYGGKNGTAILECLQQKAVEYNKLQKENNGSISFDFETAGEDNDFSLAIVIITPLMSCVHKHVKHSGELIFMDSTSNVDEKGS